MVHYYKNNKGYLLSLKPQNYFSITVISYLLLISFLIFSFVYKVSEYKEAKIIVSCTESCSYYLYSTLEDLADIKQSENIIIDKNNYFFTIKNIGALSYDEKYQTNYQLLTLNIKLPKKYQIDNLYLNAKVKIKEEKLIQKLRKLLF